VIDENIAPYVLYIPHESQFGQTRLFRQLLKSGHDRPLVLVIDELPESELSDIWRHLKPRCGSLKIVSLDHRRDEARDEEIERLNAPRLTDDLIKKILASRVGESRELDRWAAICEGSPRVAQAVRELLSRYGQFESVRNGISATFHSGGWSGPTSAYLKRKRDKLRRWLAAGFDSQIVQWIEAEIEHLDRSIEREEIDEERSRFE
jgi:hypothetical protein